MADRDRNRRANLLQVLATQKDPQLEEAVEVAMSDAELREELLAGLLCKQDMYRYNCFKVLFEVSEKAPTLLYPRWDDFVELLHSDNSYHRSIGLRIIANLTSVDTAKRFDAIFEPYFALLDDEKIITARYLAGSAAAVGRFRPDLQPRISEKLLAVDGTHHSKGRKDLLKGDIIRTLDTFFEDSPDRARILAFADAQLESSSPKTRKGAKAFLKAHTT